MQFPISRDPPEGGTEFVQNLVGSRLHRFQFLGIPPKGELPLRVCCKPAEDVFPISRDPPEGGTEVIELLSALGRAVSNF